MVARVVRAVWAVPAAVTGTPVTDQAPVAETAVKVALGDVGDPVRVDRRTL